MNTKKIDAVKESQLLFIKASVDLFTDINPTATAKKKRLISIVANTFTFILKSLKTWYNPFDRIAERHSFINALAEDVNQYMFSGDKLNLIEPYERQPRTSIPVSIENKQIVDMHFTWNHENN